MVFVTCICAVTETVSGIALNVEELLGNKSPSMWCFFLLVVKNLVMTRID